MDTIQIGMIGSGFAAELHAGAYKKIYGLEARIAGVASLAPRLSDFAAKWNIPFITEDYNVLLKDPSIKVIDIVTPAYLHGQLICEALAVGKHVICEKPLTGYFGLPGDAEPIGKNVSKSAMYDHVITELNRLEEAICVSEGLFCYAENFIYAPAVQKCEVFLKARKGKLLFLRGEESHCGSHAGYAAAWKLSGGGSLIRQGCHPLSALLYLKQREAEARGETVTVKSVVAEVGNTADCLTPEEHVHIHSHPVDVEDLAVVTVTFSDNTQALIVSGDMAVGGVRNSIELYTDAGVYTCNISPNDAMTVYHAGDKGLEDVYITEKAAVKSGFQPVFLEETLMRGYTGEFQDFMECVISGGRPKSDFCLARDTLKVIYAAYMSAEEGKRIIM